MGAELDVFDYCRGPEWWHLAVVVVAMAALAGLLIWGSCAHSGWLDGAKCCDGDWLTTAELIRYGCPDD